MQLLELHDVELLTSPTPLLALQCYTAQLLFCFTYYAKSNTFHRMHAMLNVNACFQGRYMHQKKAEYYPRFTHAAAIEKRP